MTAADRIGCDRQRLIVQSRILLDPGQIAFEIGPRPEGQPAGDPRKSLVPAIISGEQHVALGMKMIVDRLGQCSAKDCVVHPVGAVELIRRNPVELLEKSLRLADTSLPRLGTEIGDPVVIVANAQGRGLDWALPKKPLIMFGHQGAQIVGRGGQSGRGAGEGQGEKDRKAHQMVSAACGPSLRMERPRASNVGDQLPAMSRTGERNMSDHVYKIVEIVGSSPDSIEDAIQRAIARASQTIREIRWFEVLSTRGHVEDNRVGHYQVTLRIGFTLED